MEFENYKPSISQLEKFLATIELFSHLDKKSLHDLASKLNVINLPGGETLIQEHENAENLYIVMFGRLRGVRSSGGKEVVIGEIGPGGVVGEIAMLTESTRTATVYSIRDSVLLRMSKDVFNVYINKNPTAMIGIANICIKRLVTPIELTGGKNIKNIVLIPAGNNPFFSNFIAQFIKTLAVESSVIHLNQKNFDEQFGQGLSQTALESEKNSRIVSGLTDLENQYKYVIYETDSKITSWTLRCLRQADRIILIGKHELDENLNEVEAHLFEKIKRFSIEADLVLLHENAIISPYSTHRWLAKRKVNEHFHIRLHMADEMAKLCRLITGQALGLVLSGGGARGLAHAGVIRALEEANIKIDYIGGSSMGAMVAALYAMDLDYKNIHDAIAENIKFYSRGFDFTLPILSILSGKKLSILLRNATGESTNIEDLWRKYFCVSTNISKGALSVHTKGLLWRAIRASVSLPAIFPPVQDKNGDLLVDGAIMNNLPVDVMRKRLGGGRIIASKLFYPPLQTHFNLSSDTLSGWRHILTPKSWRLKVPSIGEVVMASMLLSSDQHQELMVKEADYSIVINPGQFKLLDFKSYDEIIEIGYQAALQQLSNLSI